MPYDLRKSGNQYFVVDGDGKHKNEKPMPKWRAVKYMRALYAAENASKKKQFVNHTGAMVALPIPEAYELAQGLTFPEGSEILPPEEMHITLSFMGDVSTGDINPEKLFSVIEKFAANQSPIVGKINGYGIFTETHMDDMECLWLSFDSPALPDFRQKLLSVLEKEGFKSEENHGFTPHITVAYFPKGFNPGSLYFEPKDSMILFLRVAWADMVRDFPFNVIADKKEKKGFSVFKQTDGSYRWFTISSSAFRDRDGEIITTKALEDDVDRCDTAREYGPLRWWHLGGWEAPDGVEKWETWKAASGVDVGMCDFNMLWGKMLLESGTFKTPELGDAFLQAKEKLEVSIAFAHPPDEPGKAKQFDNIHRFERSLLPEGLASNLLTKLNVVKGEPTMKTTEKLAALVAILKGKPELAKQILADAEGVQKAAEEAGLSTKEVSEMISGEPDPVEEVVIPPPVVEAVAETPPVEEVETKAAPVVPPEPVEIGDWTPEQLTAFIMDVMKQGMAKKEVEAETLNHTMKQASEAITALAEQVTKLTQGLEEQKAVTAELTDSRPVGLKQMQSKRATERQDNVVAVAPTGPHMDSDFVKFLRGGN